MGREGAHAPEARHQIWSFSRTRDMSRLTLRDYPDFARKSERFLSGKTPFEKPPCFRCFSPAPRNTQLWDVAKDDGMTIFLSFLAVPLVSFLNCKIHSKSMTKSCSSELTSKYYLSSSLFAGSKVHVKFFATICNLPDIASEKKKKKTFGKGLFSETLFSTDACGFREFQRDSRLRVRKNKDNPAVVEILEILEIRLELRSWRPSKEVLKPSS